MSTLILQEMKTNWVENENTLGYTKQATYSIQHCSLGKEVLGKLEKGNSEDKQQVQRLVIAAEACPAWPLQACPWGCLWAVTEAVLDQLLPYF